MGTLAPLPFHQRAETMMLDLFQEDINVRLKINDISDSLLCIQNTASMKHSKGVITRIKHIFFDLGHILIAPLEILILFGIYKHK